MSAEYLPQVLHLLLLIAAQTAAHTLGRID